MSDPSQAFQKAYAGTTGAIAVQLAREPGFARRMSAASLAFATAVALALSGAPEAHAQNSLKRAAIDTFAGLVGGAAGAQVGGGNGRRVAAAAGAAAGVWIAESMQENGADPRASYGQDGSVSNFGPTGWNNSSMSGMQPVRQSARQAARLRAEPADAGRWHNTRVPGMEQAGSRPTALESGATPLSRERLEKLKGMEAAYLRARDDYAQALFASEQAQDDAMLEPGSQSAAKSLKAAQERVADAQQSYGASRTSFVSAVEYMGQRGYDVVQFSLSHRLAAKPVSSDDMSRASLAKYASAGHSDRDLEGRADRASFDRPR